MTKLLQVGLSFIYLCFAVFTYAQDLNNTWQMGNNSIKFDTNPPVVSTAGFTNQYGKASVSDQNGNLLFYTDGVNVWNKNHQTMTNGNNYMNSSSFWSIAVQIAKNPSNSNEYYIFNAVHGVYLGRDSKETQSTSISSYFYSIVEFTNEYPNGRLKNVNPNLNDPQSAFPNGYYKKIIKLSDNEYISNDRNAMMAITKKGDESGLWLVLRKNKKLLTFDINNSLGFNFNHVSEFIIEPLSQFNTNNDQNFDMKFSPNNNFIFTTWNSYTSGSGYNKNEIYKLDFNSNTGVFYGNPIKVLNSFSPPILRFEFSSDSNLIYHVIRPGSTVGPYENGRVIVQNVNNLNQLFKTLDVFNNGSSINKDFIDIQKDKNNEIVLIRNNNNLVYKIENQNSFDNCSINNYFNLTVNPIPYNFYFTYNLPRNVINIENTCPTILNISTNVISGFDIKQAALTLNANNIIFNGAGADYSAGFSVVLKNGFASLNGSRFRGYINNCEGIYLKNKTNSKEFFEESNQFEESKIENNFIKIYPNPNNGIFEVQLSQETSGTLEIYDLLGKSIFNKNIVNEQNISIDLQNYPNGIYLLRLNSDLESNTYKIIKN